MLRRAVLVLLMSVLAGSAYAQLTMLGVGSGGRASGGGGGSGFAFLLEDSSNLLLENGVDHLCLEGQSSC